MLLYYVDAIFKSMLDPLLMQVTLGRETGEVHVDIDLGKEGKANKISRRQVIGPFVKLKYWVD